MKYTNNDLPLVYIKRDMLKKSIKINTNYLMQLEKKRKINEEYSFVKNKITIFGDTFTVGFVSSIPILGITCAICRNFQYTEAREIGARVGIVAGSLLIGALYARCEYKKKVSQFNNNYPDIDFNDFSNMSKEELKILNEEIKEAYRIKCGNHKKLIDSDRTINDECQGIIEPFEKTRHI